MIHNDQQAHMYVDRIIRNDVRNDDYDQLLAHINSGGDIGLIHRLLSSPFRRASSLGALIIEEMLTSPPEIKKSIPKLLKSVELLSSDVDPWRRKVFVQFLMNVGQSTPATLDRVAKLLNDVHLDVRCWAIRYVSQLDDERRLSIHRRVVDDISILDRILNMETPIPIGDRSIKALAIAELLHRGARSERIFSFVTFEDIYTIEFFKWFEGRNVTDRRA